MLTLKTLAVTSMAVCENCHIAYSRLEGNIHRLEKEVREKEKIIDSFLSIAHAQSIHISRMQASVVLSPYSRLSQAAASDSADTLRWLSKTNAGAVPDPKTESLVAVDDRLSDRIRCRYCCWSRGAVQCHSSGGGPCAPG